MKPRTAANAKIPVRVGQKWCDNGARSKYPEFTVMSIGDKEAVVERSDRKRYRIGLHRLGHDLSSRGYRLVQDVS